MIKDNQSYYIVQEKIRSVLTIKKSLQLFFIFLDQPVERKQIGRVNWSVKIERKNKDNKILSYKEL